MFPPRSTMLPKFSTAFYTPMSSIYITIAPITAATITPKMPAWTLLAPLVNLTGGVGTVVLPLGVNTGRTDFVGEGTDLPQSLTVTVTVEVGTSCPTWSTVLVTVQTSVAV